MKKILFVGLLIAGAGIVGCNTDDHDHDDATATITFDEPMNDEVIPLANADDVHIHIEFAFDPEGHEIEVKLHPEGDETNLIIDYDEHNHASAVTFMQNVDLSAYPGTEFHLEAKACLDHDCAESTISDIHFSIGQ
jgi:hypothetical protein